MKAGFNILVVGFFLATGAGLAGKNDWSDRKNKFDHNADVMKKTNFIEGKAKDSLIAAGDTVQLISNQFSFTEGPAVNKKGAIFFTDQPNNKIWKWEPNGKLSVFMEKAGRSNGMYFDRKGNLLTCADEKNEIWRINPKGKVSILLDNVNGRKLNGPNDLWVNLNGDIYFTDPYYQRPYWERKKPEIKEQNVYYLPKGKKQPVIADSSLMQPNGIVGTPDGKTLYVADIRARKIYRYTINKDGSLTHKFLLINQGSDGMVLDDRGNIYLTGNGVSVYNPQGEKILQIPVPAKWTANVCFGGKDKNLLFITASESVFILPMLVKGVE